MSTLLSMDDNGQYMASLKNHHEFFDITNFSTLQEKVGLGEFLECFCHLICGLLIEEAGRFTRLHPQVILACSGVFFFDCVSWRCG